MLSKREQALRGLFLCLQTGLPDVMVLRNALLSTSIPESGLVILRDGDAAEPDILLSPLRYICRQKAEIEVLVQEADPALRDAALDDLLSAIGAALEGNPRLSGAVDYLSCGSPEFISEAIDGAAALKGVVLPVFLEYTTTNPLF